MKEFLIVSIGTLSSLALAWCADAASPVERTAAEEIVIRAEPMPRVPEIDGVLEDAWCNVGRVDRFVDCWKGTPAAIQSQAFIGFDGDNLYIAFNCAEPDKGPLVANVKEHDGALWKDDCVEVFLDVNHDRTHYYHLAANAIGTRSDEACVEGGMCLVSNNAAWNPAWTAAAKRGETNWTVEVRIPFSELNPGVNTTFDWGINLCRERQKTANREAAEISVVSPTGRGFQVPRRFATLHIPYDWLKYAKLDFATKKAGASQDLGELKEQLANLKSKHPKAEDLRKQIDAVLARLEGLDKDLGAIGTDDARRSAFVAGATSVFAAIAGFRIEMERLRNAEAMAKAFGIQEPMFAVTSDGATGAVRRVTISVEKNNRNGAGLHVIPLWIELSEVVLQVSDLTGPAQSVLSGTNVYWQASGFARNGKFAARSVPCPVWLDVSAPADAAAGTYTGIVAIVANGERRDIHLQVEIEEEGSKTKPNLPPPPPIWDPTQALPRFDDIPYPKGISYHYVHRAIKGEYQYLLGPAVAFHKEKLVVTWENRTISEQSPNGIMRVSMSADGGVTWTPPQVIAGSGKGQDYGYGSLLSQDDRLWAFAARYQEGAPGVWFPGLCAEAFLLNEDTGKWDSRGIVAENFLPLEAPKRQSNGNWILGGENRDAHSAVAIIPANDLLKWDVVQIPFPGGAKDFEPQFSVLPDRNEVLAVVRNPPESRFALVATSEDFGKTWSPFSESNWMMTDAKSYAGTLSTGQRFLASNVPNRENLFLAVGRPGERYLSKVFKIREGRSTQPLYKGNPKRPQWSYPFVTEHDGKLYVVYDVGKEDLELAILPVTALQAE